MNKQNYLYKSIFAKTTTSSSKEIVIPPKTSVAAL